jgi:hypothetical protein
MKKQDITYQDKINELRLDLSHPNNRGIVFILLEGKSDVRLFRKLFNLTYCKVENIPGGKVKLEQCVNELTSVNSLTIGIRDADFANIQNSSELKKNIFLTDFHDMEMSLIAEDEVFSSLLFEYTSLEENQHFFIREVILTSIQKIGYLKFINETENLEFTFSPGFQDLLLFPNADIDFQQYFARVIAKSPSAKVTDINRILEKIEILKQRNIDSYQINNGHDFLKAMSKYIKDIGENALGEESICSALRMTFTIGHFKKTKLFNNIKSWADQNGKTIYN